VILWRLNFEIDRGNRTRHAAEMIVRFRRIAAGTDVAHRRQKMPLSGLPSPMTLAGIEIAFIRCAIVATANLVFRASQRQEAGNTSGDRRDALFAHDDLLN
jgi:hypothetical protein